MKTIPISWSSFPDAPGHYYHVNEISVGWDQYKKQVENQYLLCTGPALTESLHF